MLHEFISSNRDELISRTRAKVAARPWPSASTDELENGVPLFLSQHGESRMPKRAQEPTSEPAAGRAAADSDRGLSSLAAGYRQAEPYLAASSSLMSSVAGFTALGYALDRWLGHAVLWLLVVGAVVGIGVGFAAFFTQIAAATRDAAHRT